MVAASDSQGNEAISNTNCFSTELPMEHCYYYQNQ